MRSLRKAVVGGAVAIALAVGVGGVALAETSGPATTPTEPVTQEGLVNLNLTGVTVQLPIALAANLCDVEVAVLVDELSDGSAPCNASSNSDAVVATQDGGPVAQEGLVNVNVTDVVVQAPISVAANVCDVTVGVLVSRLQDGASPCDATGTADAITPTESGPPADPSPVDQEGLVNLNLTGVTVQLPIALAADVCDVEVAVLVDELSDGSAPCNASSNSNAVVSTEDGGPVAQDGLVNVNLTDVVVQAPISIAANVCDVTVAVLVSRLEDAASPCDAAATATAEAITPGDAATATGSLPVDLPTDSVVPELPTDSIVPDLPLDSLPVTVPELPVTLPTS
jgi:hypothetical protein